MNIKKKFIRGSPVNTNNVRLCAFHPHIYASILPFGWALQRWRFDWEHFEDMNSRTYINLFHFLCSFFFRKYFIEVIRACIWKEVSWMRVSEWYWWNLKFNNPNNDFFIYICSYKSIYFVFRIWMIISCSHPQSIRSIRFDYMYSYVLSSFSSSHSNSNSLHILQCYSYSIHSKQYILSQSSLWGWND